MTNITNNRTAEGRGDALRALILEAVPLARPQGGPACVRFGPGLGRDKVSAVNMVFAAREMGFRNVLRSPFERAISGGRLCPVHATIVALLSATPARTFDRLRDGDHVWSPPVTESWGLIASRIQPIAVRPGSLTRQYLDRDAFDRIAGSGAANGGRVIGLTRALKIVAGVRSIQRDPDYVLHPFTRFHGAAKPLELADMETWMSDRNGALVAGGPVNA